MNKPISSSLKMTFLAFAVIMVIVGLALLVMPGRVLVLVRWVEPVVQLPGSEETISGTVFVDPYITHGLGAALLTMAFSSYIGWKATQWNEAAFAVKLSAVFCILTLLGLIASIDFGQPLRFFVAVELILMAIFGIAFGWTWWSNRAQ